MKKWIVPVLMAAVLGGVIQPPLARADADLLGLEIAAAEAIKDQPEWVGVLKEQHYLSDEHIQWMQDRGLNYPQMLVVSLLSEKSGKTVDDILEMRVACHSDWKKMAGLLDLSGPDLSTSVASSKNQVIINAEKSKEAKREIIKKGFNKNKG